MTSQINRYRTSKEDQSLSSKNLNFKEFMEKAKYEIYPPFTVSPTDKPEWVAKRAGLLVRLYHVKKSHTIAEAVTEHIHALLAYPGYIVDAKQRCQYLRLATHWRCLAWINKHKV